MSDESSQPAPMNTGADIEDRGAGAFKPASAPAPPPAHGPTPPPAPDGARPAPAAQPDAISNAGWFGWQFPFGIGVAAVGGAALRAGIEADAAAGAHAEKWWWAAGRVALLAPLGAALGFLALFVFAKLVRRPFGDARMAAARMLAAVGVFHLVWRIGVLPTSYEWYNAAFAFSLGLAAYLGSVALTFRLKRDELLQVVGLHAGFVIVAHAIVWLVPALFASGEPKTTEPVQAPPIHSTPQTRPAPSSETPAQPPSDGAPSAAPPAPEPAPAEPPPVEPSSTPPPAPPGNAGGAPGAEG